MHKLGNYAMFLRADIKVKPNYNESKTAALRRGEAIYLIPWLLPEVQPFKLNSLWPPHVREGESIFGRYYIFEFIPKV